MIHNLMAVVQDGGALDGATKTFLQYGVLGALVVVLLFVVWRLDSERRQLYNERIEQEKRFGQEKADMIVKYKDSTDKVMQTLEATNRVIERLAARGGG